MPVWKHALTITIGPQVLLAMAVPTEVAVGTLRLSTGRHTTIGEVDKAAELIAAAALRQIKATESSASSVL